jgi:hypothetical protein
MNAIMNEKSSQSSWQNIQLQMCLQKYYMCIHVYKYLTPMHDYSSILHRIAGQAHRRTITRMCVVSAGWPSPMGVSNPVALPCDNRMSM